MKIETNFIIAIIAGVVNASTTKSVSETTLTYSASTRTFSYAMTPPNDVKKMKLYCADTKNSEKEYCTEIIDKEHGNIYDCYDFYTAYATMIDELNYCTVYTQQPTRTLMKERKICSDYHYVENTTVTSGKLCRTKMARYNNPLEPGYTYTSGLIGTKHITFPVPEEVTAVTIKCDSAPLNNEDYAIFKSVYGYEYETPTSVPFSILDQDYTTVDNPEFTETYVKSTKTVNEDISTETETTAVYRTGSQNIYMGDIVTHDDGEITTKMPIVAATLNYCDKNTANLCYGAYAVTDICTIFTRTAATKVVPENYITDAETPTETPEITITRINYITTTETEEVTETVKVSETQEATETEETEKVTETKETTETEEAEKVTQTKETTETEEAEIVTKTKESTETEEAEKVTKTEKTTEVEFIEVTPVQQVKESNKKPENCKNVYEQCGGKSYTGPECCVNSKCVALNDYYHQCLPY